MLGHAPRKFENQLMSGPIISHRLTVVGFHLLVVFWLLAAFFPSYGLSIIKISTSLVLLMAVCCFATQIFIILSKPYRIKFDSISNLILVTLFFWSLITIVRALNVTDADRFFTLLANPDIGGLVWFLPFAVYLGRQPGVLRALLPAFRWHAVIGIALVASSIYQVAVISVSPREIEAKVGLALQYAAPFVLLTGVGNRADRRIYSLALASAAVAHFYLGNRAGFVMSFGILLLSLALGRVRVGGKVALRVAAFSLIAMMLTIPATNYLSLRLGDEWFVDTRTFIWEEINDDFSSKDWFIGRGALGQYYSPYFDRLSRLGGEGDSPYRQVSEVGYLHVALKAGLIGVALYLLVMLRAAFCSLRIQDKRFGVGLIALLVLHILEMAVVGQLSFQPSRVLLWMLVGVALSLPKNQSSRRQV